MFTKCWPLWVYLWPLIPWPVGAAQTQFLFPPLDYMWSLIPALWTGARLGLKLSASPNLPIMLASTVIVTFFTYANGCLCFVMVLAFFTKNGDLYICIYLLKTPQELWLVNIWTYVWITFDSSLGSSAQVSGVYTYWHWKSTVVAVAHREE